MEEKRVGNLEEQGEEQEKYYEEIFLVKSFGNLFFSIKLITNHGTLASNKIGVPKL